MGALKSTERVAIIGSGIAGLSCYYFLSQHFNVTLFEKNNYIGGHTNTITVQDQSQSIPMDTGFMVFNPMTYPNLIRLFKHLGVAASKTDMSFSVQHLEDDLEWNGAGLIKLFAQRRNLLRPRYYRFLGEVNRFNQLAALLLQEPQPSTLTMKAFVAQYQFSQDFYHWFLLPMSSAIWSTNPKRLEAFPIITLLRFFKNHGFLGLRGHYQWYTPTSGAKQYVEQLLKRSQGQVNLNTKLRSVAVSHEAAHLHFEDEESQAFDRVIFACHADQALRLLVNPTLLQQNLLSPFTYERNDTVLHSDKRVLPKRKAAWAAWNYRVERAASQATSSEPGADTSVHYWMNRLQHLPTRTPMVVSLNARALIDPALIHYQITYEHPIFTVDAVQAQARLAELNSLQENNRLFFTGSYFGYGFHEDALKASLDLIQRLTGVSDPWGLVA